MHSFLETDVIFLVPAYKNSRNGESEAESQTDNGLIVFVWEKAARD